MRFGVRLGSGTRAPWIVRAEALAVWNCMPQTGSMGRPYPLARRRLRYRQGERAGPETLSNAL